MSETIHYTPGNCVLLVGPAGLLLKRQEMLRIAGLRSALLCTDPDDRERIGIGMRALAGQLADVSGWMGAFSARLDSPLGAIDLGPLSHHEDGHFDWILDFTADTKSFPPPGYYRLPPDDFPALKRALLEIARHTREGHERPRYVALDARLCAHRRQGVAGCSACIGTCPAGAITGDGNSVRVEAHLCEGCAACTQACTTGALGFLQPDTASSLQRLSTLLADHPGTGLWIVPDDNHIAPTGWLTFAVDTPAGLGIEFWLAALAGGCRRVAVSAGNIPEHAWTALTAQLAVARAILVGLGRQPAIDVAETPAQLDWIPSIPETPPSALRPNHSRRELLDATLDLLFAEGAEGEVEIALPLHAPLGTVVIAAERCTLCSACARICPFQALALPEGTGQLAFTEARCTQCGLCVSACPEQALHLKPRLLSSSALRHTPRIVASAEMVSCPDCGKAFTSRAMLERSRAVMANPMFQGEQARLLALCLACRQLAIAPGANTAWLAGNPSDLPERLER